LSNQNKREKWKQFEKDQMWQKVVERAVLQEKDLIPKRTI